MTRPDKGIWKCIFFIYIAAVLFCCFWHFNDFPKPPAIFLGIPVDKAVHFAMFFPFPFLAWLAFDRFTVKHWQSIVFVLISFLAGCLLAAFTEAGQSLTSYRNGDILDFTADVSSLAVSSLIVLFIDIRKQEK